MQNSFAKGSQYGFATFYSGKCQHQWAKQFFQGLMSTDCREMKKVLQITTYSHCKRFRNLIHCRSDTFAPIQQCIYPAKALRLSGFVLYNFQVHHHVYCSWYSLLCTSRVRGRQVQEEGDALRIQPEAQILVIWTTNNSTGLSAGVLLDFI